MTNAGDRPREYTFSPQLAEVDSNGAGHPQETYSLDTPEARAVADLLAIQLDLRFVTAACGMLLQLSPNDVDVDSQTLTRALWSASLIAYARCFATGKRIGLSERDVALVPGDGATEFHRTIMNVRNKHIAHSVNPFELIEIGVMVGKFGSEEPEVTGMAAVLGSAYTPHPTTVDNLARMSDFLLSIIATRLEEQTPLVLDSARSQGLDALKRRPKLRFTTPGTGDPGSARPK